MNDYRKEEINSSPLEADGNQETFDFTPSPFSIKEARTLNSGKMILWDTGPPSSWSTDFLNEVAVSYPNNSPLHLLACWRAV